MGLISKNRIKYVGGNTNLELEARANESLRIKEIHIGTPAGSYITVSIDRKSIHYLRCGGTGGSHVQFVAADQHRMNLFNMLVANGLFAPIPVATGETFKITGAAQSTSHQCVVYDVYDANDVKPTETNGSQSKVSQFISYGRFNTTLAAGENNLDTMTNPSEFHAFPWSKAARSGAKTKLLGVAFSDFGKDSGSGSNVQLTDYLKLIRNQETLFDDDKNGFPFQASDPGTDTETVGAGVALFGNYSAVDERLPLIFPEPMVFDGGEELDVIVTTTLSAGSANIAAEECEVALFLQIEPMA